MNPDVTEIERERTVMVPRCNACGHSKADHDSPVGECMAVEDTDRSPIGPTRCSCVEFSALEATPAVQVCQCGHDQTWHIGGLERCAFVETLAGSECLCQLFRPR